MIFFATLMGSLLLKLPSPILKIYWTDKLLKFELEEFVLLLFYWADYIIAAANSSQILRFKVKKKKTISVMIVAGNWMRALHIYKEISNAHLFDTLYGRL